MATTSTAGIIIHEIDASSLRAEVEEIFAIEARSTLLRVRVESGTGRTIFRNGYVVTNAVVSHLPLRTNAFAVVAFMLASSAAKSTIL
jgi:hypothetical protein